MNICLYTYICTRVHAWCPSREKKVSSPGPGVTDARECWELNVRPLQEHPLFYLKQQPCLQPKEEGHFIVHFLLSLG